MLLSVSQFIGRFHPVLVHLPIGILLIALLLQWLSQKKGYAVAHGVLKLLWGLGAASALLSCITGYLLSVQEAYDDTAVALHMWSGIAVAALSLLLFAKVSARQIDAVYKAAAVALALLIGVTGHLGGSLTHGSGYLTGAFTTVDTTDSLDSKPIANIQQAPVYAGIVQPILQAKCYSCHGAKKQKGDLRLDDSVRLLKGSEDGPVLIAGNAAESELVKSLLLPREAKAHMPPRDKPQLTKNQIAIIQWWVAQGAPFDKKVAELTQPEIIKPVLIALQHGEMKKSEAVWLPSEPVNAAAANDIAALQKRGVLVQPVAQNSNYLAVNFTTTTGLTNKDVALLLPLKQQLVWLKAGNAAFSDSALTVIGQCTNLFALWLNGTAITDAGLPALRPLKNLQLLNLVSTNVTATGVLQLKALTHLKSLYLYGTKELAAGWPALQNAFPHTLLDTGGYKVATLVTDTTEVREAKK